MYLSNQIRNPGGYFDFAGCNHLADSKSGIYLNNYALQYERCKRIYDHGWNILYGVLYSLALSPSIHYHLLMILILSDRNDLPTYKVAKSLEYLGNTVMILTDEDELTGVNITGADIKLELYKTEIRFSEIKAYWYRRGNFNMPKINTGELAVELLRDINYEKGLTVELLHIALLEKPHLGSIFNSDLNRLGVLWKARQCGLETPCTGLFNKKPDVVDFQNRYKKIILKPLGNGVNFIKNNKLYASYTCIFSNQDTSILPDYFPATLFMEYVEKKYEVRVFYLDEECYSLATFSQGDPQTEVDYRRYNKEWPNRSASFVLPHEIANKIGVLMKKLKLNTGSIDIIVTPDDRFIFLEVNPVGQFLNIQELANHNLCAKIAEYLDKIANHE